MDARAIVIGTGFGGAVAALRLGEAGIQTLVLERGRRWPISDPAANGTFTTFEELDRRAEWLNSTGLTQTPAYDGKPTERYTGVLQVRPAGEITLLVGCGVGGGSLAYGGILIEPPRHLFHRAFPASVDYDEMARVYFPRVRSVIASSPIPDDILKAEQFRGLRVFRDQALKAGYPEAPSTKGDKNAICRFRMAVDWDLVRDELAGRKVPSYSKAEFWFGNNSGAKQTLDRDYVRQAEETGSVDVRPLHNVTHIAQEPDGSYAVFFQRLADNGDVTGEGTLSCRYLFLAAGTLGTNELLLRARARGALENLDDHLGQGFGDDGDMFVIRANLPENTNPHLGCPGCFALMNYENPILPVVAMRAPLPRFEQDFPKGDSLATFVFAMTDHRGRLVYDEASDGARVEFAHDQQAEDAARAAIGELCAVSGGEIISATAQITGHQLGGAAMGQVCDDAGRVAGHPNLFVVDGALIPGSSTCVNPALTIAAISERCMDRLLAADVRPD